MVIIHPGEYVVTAEDCVLCTVLGSCVAVALYDRTAGLGGLNHFMLPGAMHRSLEASQSAKYGMYAMELLVNELLRKGARREKLEAKAFGGGSVLGDGQEAASGISRSNVEFVLEYLATEGIPLRSSDLGGTQARKILYFTADSSVLLKRYGGKAVVKVEREENRYLEALARIKDTLGQAYIFEKGPGKGE